VQTLADIQTFAKRNDGKLLGLIFKPIPGTPYSILPDENDQGKMPTAEECRKARDFALQHPLAPQLISPDARATLVIARLHGDDLPIREISPFIADMRRLIEKMEHTSALKIRLTGLAPIRTEIYESVQYESTRFVWVGGLLAVAMAAWMFRRVAAVAIVCGSALVGAVWTIGAMGLFGEKMNILTTVLPTLVLVVGFTDAVHLMIDIRRERALGVSPSRYTVLEPSPCAEGYRPLTPEPAPSVVIRTSPALSMMTLPVPAVCEDRPMTLAPSP